MSEQTPKPQCVGLVRGGYFKSRCGKGASVVRDKLHYCKIHDPVAIKERSDAKSAKWAAEWREKERAQAANRQIQQARDNVAAVALQYFEQKAMHAELEAAVAEYRKFLLAGTEPTP